MTQLQLKKLEEIPLTKQLVEELFAQEKISKEGRTHALDMIQPAGWWRLWLSRYLLAMGCILTLSGIIFFFAYNWAEMSAFAKFALIQGGILVCVGGAFAVSLKRFAGQMLLLAASILTGVFMAVFGQIYQTGADAYELFMMWSLLVFGWTVLSNFAFQWICWLTITNLFIFFWWQQDPPILKDAETILYMLLCGLNTTALILREVFLKLNRADWLQPRWIGLLLLVGSLVPLHISTSKIHLFHSPIISFGMIISMIVMLLLNISLFYFYRHKKQDLRSLAIVIFSLCVAAEVHGMNFIIDSFLDSKFLVLFAAGLMTIGIFAGAIFYMQKLKSR